MSLFVPILVSAGVGVLGMVTAVPTRRLVHLPVVLLTSTRAVPRCIAPSTPLQRVAAVGGLPAFGAFLGVCRRGCGHL